MGVASIAALLDPDVVVVGGGVAAAGDLLVEPARQRFEREVTAGRHRDMPSWAVARMGNTAGIVGAADLAR